MVGCRLAAGVLLSLAWSTLAAKVQVRIYFEAGCPYCNQYLTGPLRHALDDKDAAPAMEVSISPFGNAYFLTERCAPANSTANATSNAEYDVGRRDCFNAQCGPDSGGHAGECFSGQLVCQHGARECSFNRYMACAKRAAPRVSVTAPSHLPFVTCMEDHYWNTTDDSPSDAVLAACTSRSGVERAELDECYRGAGGDAAIAEEAAATPPHSGVPWVTIDGRPVSEGYEVDALVRGVRESRDRRHQRRGRTGLLAAGAGAPPDGRGEGRTC